MTIIMTLPGGALMGSDLCAGVETCIGNYYSAISDVIYNYGSTLRWLCVYTDKVMWTYLEDRRCRHG